MTDLIQSENSLPPKWLYRLESLNPKNGQVEWEKWQ